MYPSRVLNHGLLNSESAALPIGHIDPIISEKIVVDGLFEPVT